MCRNAKSMWETLQTIWVKTVGICMGSVLGSLLFLIYINDLETIAHDSFLFADDTTVLIKYKNKHELVKEITETISKVS